jgi:hypothetical protein
MMLVVGLVALGAGILWLVWMAQRAEGRTGTGQAVFDFLAGAPLESVLSVGLTLLGLLVVAAQLL